MKKILKYWYLPLIVLVMNFVYVINNSSNNDNVYASNNVEAKEALGQLFVRSVKKEF